MSVSICESECVSLYVSVCLYVVVKEVPLCVWGVSIYDDICVSVYVGVSMLGMGLHIRACMCVGVFV